MSHGYYVNVPTPLAVPLRPALHRGAPRQPDRDRQGRRARGALVRAGPHLPAGGRLADAAPARTGGPRPRPRPRRSTSGYYEWGGEHYVPSWGGSMFEALMPTLVLDEQRYAREEPRRERPRSTPSCSAATRPRSSAIRSGASRRARDPCRRRLRRVRRQGPRLARLRSRRGHAVRRGAGARRAPEAAIAESPRARRALRRLRRLRLLRRGRSALRERSPTSTSLSTSR